MIVRHPSRFLNSLSTLLSIALMSLCLALPTFAEESELKKTLFASATGALKEANKVQGSILAPVSYGKGADLYRSAEKRFEKNRRVSTIEAELAEAAQYFRQATKAAKITQLTFKSTIQARKDAEGVGAEKLAGEEWRKAEERFLLATRTLETGNMARAKTRASDAEKIYRDAELTAIKGNYLNQTRAMIEKANKMKVKKFAPDTLARATELLATAEKELSENRYDTDYPRSLVKEAFYQAKHSIYLAQQIQALDEREISAEQLILKMEQPVASIAGNLDLVAEFDQGFEAPVAAINEKIEALQNDSYELGELKNKMSALEQDYAMLENKLGIQSERLQMEEEARERIQRITEYFERDEAIVLRQGNDVLIRVVGLNFNPGSAQINSENFALLSKLEQAINAYPDYTVVVEGHTDSFGSDATNQALSLDRARAVRQYFLVNMDNFSASRSEAFGYGESRPIANNETPEGRKRNRRIDLLLKAPSS